MGEFFDPWKCTLGFLLHSTSIKDMIPRDHFIEAQKLAAEGTEAKQIFWK